MDRPPVHELSAVNGHSLRFKYRATPTIRELRLQRWCVNTIPSFYGFF